jgi:formylglycine-generating enzyme required for sulfatase activity
MRFVSLPSGEFEMGLEHEPVDAARRFGGAADWYEREQPQHHVTMTRKFSLGTTHVTRGQFARFVRETGYRTTAEQVGIGLAWNGSKFAKAPSIYWLNVGFEQRDDHPVVCVGSADAEAFCAWLSGVEHRSYRLPSEAEWEYASRAGQPGAYTWGDDPNDGKGWANAADLCGKQQHPEWTTFNWNDGYVFTSPVATFRPNAWGLYDMAGNAWEWTRDFYAPYSPAAVIDPMIVAETDSGAKRVLRGGSWYGAPLSCRHAYRSQISPAYAGSNAGFRVAVEE